MKWDDYFVLAKEYFEKNGNLAVPQKYETSSGIKLGIWINTQRRAYKGTSKSKINEIQIKKLESIGMIWEVKNRDFDQHSSWEHWYSEAEKYFIEKGNLLVPFGYSTCEGFNLGYWISEQRGKYKREKLSSEQIELLNKIGMVWQVKGDFSWEKCFESAKKYFEINGDLLVPQSYVDDSGFTLGVWINNLRAKYKGDISPQLTAEQIKELEGIGMVWSVKPKRAWEFYYEYALRFYEHNLSLCVPVNYEVDGIKLGKWIANQRRYRKAGKLNKLQIDLLDNIEMVWEVKSRTLKK